MISFLFARMEGYWIQSIFNISYNHHIQFVSAKTCFRHIFINVWALWNIDRMGMLNILPDKMTWKCVFCGLSLLISNYNCYRNGLDSYSIVSSSFVDVQTQWAESKKETGHVNILITAFVLLQVRIVRFV